MNNTTLSTISTLALSLALLACVTVLLIMHIITVEQAGYFVVAAASLPLFHGALQTPSQAQQQQLQSLIANLPQMQSENLQQILAQVSSLVRAQQKATPPEQSPTAQVVKSSTPPPTLQVPFPTSTSTFAPLPEDTMPHAALSMLQSQPQQ
jgi:predicted PurR-regulated permease PerM